MQDHNKQSVGLTSLFLESLSKLSRTDQQKVQQTIHKVSEDPASPGLRRHKLENTSRGMISFSAGMDLRLICLSLQDKQIMLYVDHHDGAYKWATTHKIITNDQMSFFEVVPINVATADDEIQINASSGRSATRSGGQELRGKYGLSLAHDLSGRGLPEELIEDVKQLDNEEDLVLYLEHVSTWLQELVLGVATNVVPDLQTLGDQVPSVVVLNDDEELRLALLFPLENWRLFLHPIQSDVVMRGWQDRTAIVAPPGTGKTIILVHRAVKLSKDGKKVMLLTRSKDLAEALITLVDKLLTQPHNIIIGFTASSQHIDVTIFRDKIVFHNNQVHTPCSIRYDSSNQNSPCTLQGAPIGSVIDHILIDEAQDLYPDAQTLLTYISGKQTIGLTIALDFAQMVFGSKVEILYDLIYGELFNVTKLTYSYRLTREIIKFAKTVQLHSTNIASGIQELKKFTQEHHAGVDKKVVTASGGDTLLFYGLIGNTIEIKVCRERSIIKLLSETVSDYNKVYKTSDYIILCPSDDGRSFVEKFGRMHAMTYRAAKGQEWFAGIVIADKHWFESMEHNLLRATPASLIAVNSFYVAITRFRETLTFILVEDCTTMKMRTDLID